jgi:hypothetical protein
LCGTAENKKYARGASRNIRLKLKTVEIVQIRCSIRRR